MIAGRWIKPAPLLAGNSEGHTTRCGHREKSGAAYKRHEITQNPVHTLTRIILMKWKLSTRKAGTKQVEFGICTAFRTWNSFRSQSGIQRLANFCTARALQCDIYARSKRAGSVVGRGGWPALFA